MDRVFFTVLMSGLQTFYLKPAAAVVSARRAGTTATFDQLNKYFSVSQMPIVSSSYWNMVHGFTPEDVRQDLEGLQAMRTLGRNMAWLLKCKEAGIKAGIPLPEREKAIRTNFIR
jgi:multimeric flavodoxin WrbA